MTYLFSEFNSHMLPIGETMENNNNGEESGCIYINLGMKSRADTRDLISPVRSVSHRNKSYLSRAILPLAV